MASRRATEGPKEIHPTRPKLAEELQTALPLKAAVVLGLKCSVRINQTLQNFQLLPTVSSFRRTVKFGKLRDQGFPDHFQAMIPTSLDASRVLSGRF